MPFSLTDSSDHYLRLTAAYSEVADRTWSHADFLEENLDASRNLFTPQSIVDRSPVPKVLEVYALLSGLPFSGPFTESLVEVQRRISMVLGDRLHYWVAPANLGVEYCVFKWPTDDWREDRIGVIKGVLDRLRQPAFRFHIQGVQVNPDGCVVARGYDEGAVLFQVRECAKREIPFLPSRQSGWAHVPLGRILEPLGAARFLELSRLMRELSEASIAVTEVDSLKVVHETRWYMEEKSVLAEYELGRDG